MQDEDKLELLLRRQHRPVVQPAGFRLYLRLLFEPQHQPPDRFVKFIMRDFGTEIQQQFAHVVVAFLYAFFDETQFFRHFRFGVPL